MSDDDLAPIPQSPAQEETDAMIAKYFSVAGRLEQERQLLEKDPLSFANHMDEWVDYVETMVVTPTITLSWLRMATKYIRHHQDEIKTTTPDR